MNEDSRLQRSSDEPNSVPRLQPGTPENILAEGAKFKTKALFFVGKKKL